MTPFVPSQSARPLLLRALLRSVGIVVLLLGSACRKDAGSALKQQSSVPSTDAASEARGEISHVSRKATAIEAGAQPSPEQRKMYNTHLAAGRRFAAKKMWADATAEFEKALATMPGDARAQSELGWAAFNAGDHDKARKASTGAVKQAMNEQVKAASLYNLGRVEEAAGRREVAAKLYQESVALRPNAIVADRLKSLDVAVRPESDAPELFCIDPVPLDQVCRCIEHHAVERDLGPADEHTCDIDSTEPAPGIRIARAGWSRMEQSILLLAQSSKGWSVVAELEGLYNPGAFGISEDWELGPVVVEDLGGRRILKVLSLKTRSDCDMGINEVEGVDTTTLTVCVLGPDGGETRCPLQVPQHYVYARDTLRFDEELDREEKAQREANVKEFGTRNLPIRKETDLKIDLAPDGTANVTLVKGDASGLKGVLGPKKLW